MESRGRIDELNDLSTPKGTSSQRTALKALLSSKSDLGIQTVTQCDGYHADGFVTMRDGQKIPFEIKETLGWPQLMSACFQLVSMNHWLELKANEAWIVYEKLSNEWTNRFGDAALTKAERDVEHFKAGMRIRFLRVNPDGTVVHTGGQGAPN
jgi:hypothetical protein